MSKSWAPRSSVDSPPLTIGPDVYTSRLSGTWHRATAMSDAKKTSVTIRPSRDADVPPIREIYAYHVLHGLASFEEVPPSVDDMVARRLNVLAKKLPYVVAE